MTMIRALLFIVFLLLVVMVGVRFINVIDIVLNTFNDLDKMSGGEFFLVIIGAWVGWMQIQILNKQNAIQTEGYRPLLYPTKEIVEYPDGSLEIMIVNKGNGLALDPVVSVPNQVSGQIKSGFDGVPGDSFLMILKPNEDIDGRKIKSEVIEGVIECRDVVDQLHCTDFIIKHNKDLGWHYSKRKFRKLS